MLLNFTIQHLALQKYSGQSPIFNIGNRGNCVFKALSINKITSNFIYSNQKFQRLEILNSKFSHSLKSVVSLNRDDTINNTKFHDALALDQDTIVKNCVFDSCTSEAKGSAISSEGRRLTVDFCLFQGCEAVSNGGAIYIQSVGFLVKKSCFANCTTSSFGQAIYHTDGKNLGETDTVKDTIFYRCSLKQYLRNAAALFSMTGKMAYTYNNCTKCECKKNGACITFLNSEPEIISHSTFAFSSAPSVIDISHCQTSIKIHYCNFLSNVATEKSALVVVSAETMISECYMEKNSSPFADRSVGQPYQVVIFNCTYDSLGTPLTNDVVYRAGKNIEVDDSPLMITLRGQNHCYTHPEDSFFRGFNLNVFFMVCGTIILTHILIIHTNFIFRLFSRIISGDERQKKRRRAAKKRNEME
ncbi:hypothetical protein TVAG_118090 [Trichomonas vaginalis G3]|uniref:Right handed beta helix domain-containing protein n=1 Tax=Trichomonas vaginalis (strain ATCC PRA-98 / G3) TaxID=412133 RepID=A2EHZ6_TRIV3|nr:pectin lyase-like family [Trichomonas vaginalis G3]EAY07728.1 hypothetical protein TVAG_118090 [Trichomonas vaginalis G3]KAI5552571.1 pectin lyase-like family [Trichomonas vaginalis G3]|eukprot:XP_001319951.1 hypothetical protein [Trichomonas vaginalis G3]